MPGSSGRVFISYRRQETAWPARQLYELLSERFGADQVFKDIDNIAPGDDFVEQVSGAVGSCDVLLALIGESWLTVTDEQGRRRLDDPDDFVRLEIETALERNDVRVIPILVDAARMPKADDLPAPLRPLVRRQAVQLNAISFDATRLLQAVQDTLAEMRPVPADPVAADPVAAEPVPADPVAAEPAAEGPDDPRDPPPAAVGGSGPSSRAVTRTVAAAGVAVVLLVGGLLLWRAEKPADDKPSSERQTSTSTSSGASSSSTPSGGGPSGSAVLAHRGGEDTFPPESLPALTSAAASGYAVETDVRWTSDQVAVIVHDEAANRKLDCTRAVNVSQTTWQELRSTCRSKPIRPGGKQYPIATYPQAMDGIATADQKAWAYVELKADRTPAQLRQFLDVLRSKGLGSRSVVTSFEVGRLKAMHDVAPDQRLMLFLGTQTFPASQLAADGLWAVAVDSSLATKKYVAQLHHAGLVVVDYLLNKESDWAGAKAVGADKVLTDHPSAYAAWLSSQ